MEPEASAGGAQSPTSHQGAPTPHWRHRPAHPAELPEAGPRSPRACRETGKHRHATAHCGHRAQAHRHQSKQPDGVPPQSGRASERRPGLTRTATTLLTLAERNPGVTARRCTRMPARPIKANDQPAAAATRVQRAPPPRETRGRARIDSPGCGPPLPGEATKEMQATGGISWRQAGGGACRATEGERSPCRQSQPHSRAQRKSRPCTCAPAAHV